MEKRIVIIGAGPTGLGAANQLFKKGYKNWAVYDRNDYIGGLSASFVDDKGFTWDVGGHVVFSHFGYFDKLLIEVLGDKYLSHERESWVWMLNSWVPYPFQNNIKFLPSEAQLECLLGLLEVYKVGKKETANFEEWIYSIFGKGIAKYFMIPYNFKVWATPAKLMQKDWIAERVSVVDIERVLKNVILDKADVSWGPNNTFNFPLHGGTGEIYRKVAERFNDKVHLKRKLVKVDAKEKKLYFEDGTTDKYDYLVTTAALDQFTKALGTDYAELAKASDGLNRNGTLIVGVGVEKPLNSNKCWMYFPQDDSPFYRVTYFSNYSHNNVPAGDTKRYHSQMCEVSYSEHKKESKDDVIERSIQGLINSKMLEENDRKKIVTKFLLDVPYSYPVPTLSRDGALKKIQPALEKMDIYSRGRFGAWRYEIGNMDHSLMMGVEIIDRLLENKPEGVFNSK
jgi:protoporphyrinogen oxidase